MQERSFSRVRKDFAFDIDGEAFKCMAVPGGLFIDFARKSQEANEAEMAEMLYDIFTAVMEPDDFERFWELCRTSLDIDTMMEIVNWMASATADRPTVPSSRSARGRSRTKAAAGSSGAVRALSDSPSATAAT